MLIIGYNKKTNLNNRANRNEYRAIPKEKRMKPVTEAIADYILYLKNEKKLYVTIHSHGDELTHLTGLLAPFNIHSNPYCVLVKSYPEQWNECIRHQKKIFEHIRAYGDEIFFGSCYAGVGEYIVPVCENGEIYGFISVGGYAGNLHKAKSAALTYQMSYASLKEHFETYLSEQIPDYSEITALLLPLRYMMVAAYHEKPVTCASAHELVAASALTYLHRNFASALTLDGVAAYCGCSRRTLSAVFAAKTGFTVQKYIEKLRMEKARSLLGETALSVTEIAFLCGYSDANYFSSRFSKYFGMPPSRFLHTDTGLSDEIRP